jgi:hypothetical protein
MIGAIIFCVFEGTLTASTDKIGHLEISSATRSLVAERVIHNDRTHRLERRRN